MHSSGETCGALTYVVRSRLSEASPVKDPLRSATARSRVPCVSRRPVHDRDLCLADICSPRYCLFSRRAPASRSATRSCERMDERSSRFLNRFGGSPDDDAPSNSGACGGGVFFLARSGSTEPLTLRRITTYDPGSLAGSPWICRGRFRTPAVNGDAYPDPKRLPSTGAPRGAFAAPSKRPPGPPGTRRTTRFRSDRPHPRPAGLELADPR
jgi:hypothetical protein